MKKHILLAGAAAGLALAASAANAQSIDYGSLQELFGEPVTTSATGSPQRATEAPADMQIITADEIRRSGETSLPGILQRVAGIDVLNLSAGHSDINVRGYNQAQSTRLLVLVNGRQVYLDHYGMTMWSAIPVQLSEIRQIEVVKGPGSALFGFNAASGVVNIITYNPQFDDADQVTLSAGTGGATSGSLVTTFKLSEAISARLSAGGTRADEWKITGARPLPGDLAKPSTATANLDIVAQLAPKTELRMEASWANVTNSQIAGGAGYRPVKTLTKSAKATLTSDTDYGSIQGQIYQNWMRGDFAGGVVFDNAIMVASLQDMFKIGTDHTLRIGGEYRHNTLNVAVIPGAEVSYDVLAASGMWNWQINEKFTTTVAARVDKMSMERTGGFLPRVHYASNALWDRSITEPSLNLTAAWRPTASDTIRLSYGRGVTTPSLVNLGGLHVSTAIAPGFILNIFGKPDIKASIVTNTELAYDHDFTPIKAKLGVRVFAQQWKDLVSSINAAGLDYMPTATTNAGTTYFNVSDSKEKGVEFTASGRATDNMTWRADYTWTDVKDTAFPGFNMASRFTAFQETTPSGRGNIGVDWVKGPWEADANLHYVGDFRFYDITNGALQPVKAFTSLSSRVGYKTESGVTLALAGQNLMTERQKQTRGLEAERRVQFTISKTW